MLGLKMLELCAQRHSRGCDEPFAFHNKTALTPSSQGDPMNTLYCLSLSYKLYMQFVQVDDKVVIKWTEDLWFPCCHSLPDMTG